MFYMYFFILYISWRTSTKQQPTNMWNALHMFAYLGCFVLCCVYDQMYGLCCKPLSLNISLSYIILIDIVGCYWGLCELLYKTLFTIVRLLHTRFLFPLFLDISELRLSSDVYWHIPDAVPEHKPKLR